MKNQMDDVCIEKLKEMENERSQLDRKLDWKRFDELDTKIFRMKRALHDLRRNSAKIFVACPFCGDGKSYHEDPYYECEYCFGLGFIDQKTRMKYVRSYIGIEEKERELMRELMCRW